MPALPAVGSRVFLGTHCMYQGDFAHGLELMEEAVHIAEAAGHPYSLFYACYALGGVHVSQGRPDLGLPWLERSLDLCREGNFAFLFPVLSTWLGRAWAFTDRIPEALALLDQAARQVASMRTGNFGAQVGNALAEVYMVAGRVDDAMASARDALQRAREQREPVAESIALWLLGEIFSRSRTAEPEQAEASYRAALTLAAPLGLRPLIAKCHLGVGKLYRRNGDPQGALEQLSTATKMFREMDMRFWLEQAEAEMPGFG
ncbi:MAG TPA: tetratricopeptide repeat protein [Methylomirabilota bacterium]